MTKIVGFLLFILSLTPLTNTYCQTKDNNSWHKSKVITVDNDTLIGIIKQQEIINFFDFKELNSNKKRLFDSKKVLTVFIDSVEFNSIFIPVEFKGIKGHRYYFGKLLANGKYKFYRLNYGLRKEYYLFQGDSCLKELEVLGGSLANLYKITKYFQDIEIVKRLENKSFTIEEFAQLINDYK